MNLFKKKNKKIEVLIYSKPDCHLCDQAKLVLSNVRGRFDFDLKEVDITESKNTYEFYKEQIPVIYVNGRKAFKYRVAEEELIRKLKLLTS